MRFAQQLIFKRSQLGWFTLRDGGSRRRRWEVRPSGILEAPDAEKPEERSLYLEELSNSPLDGHFTHAFESLVSQR